MSVESAGAAAVRALLESFSSRTGRWRTPTGEAWQPALAVEAVLLAYERTRVTSLLNVVEKSFGRYRGRRSRFFDDDGWYLNAWVRAYDVTGDPKYLAEARALFETMTHGWDDHCGGGLWWSADRTYKNAITNELFLLAAARLARRTGGERYEKWARKAWHWFDSSGMINSDDLVNDGLNSACVNNGQPTWSYNQGVILSALTELWRLTGDPAPLVRAGRIAAAAMGSNVHSGHMVACEPGGDAAAFGNRDAHGFKGVFAQGLARLHAALGTVDPATALAIRSFLEANAASVWRDGAGDFGMSWLGGNRTGGGSGPAVETNPGSMSRLGDGPGAGEGSGGGPMPGPGSGGGPASGSGGGPMSGPGSGGGMASGLWGAVRDRLLRAPSGPVNAATRASAALLLGAVELFEAGGETVELPPLAGVRYEAELARLVGVGSESIYKGFTGTGYAASGRADGQAVVFTLDGRGVVDGPGREIHGGGIRGGENRGGDNHGGDNHGGDNHGGENHGGENHGGENRGRENRGRENRGRENRGRENRGHENDGRGGRMDGLDRTVGPGGRRTILTLRYAAGAGDAFRQVLVDGAVRADRLLFTGTNGWDSYDTVSLDVSLSLGSVVEVRFDAARGSRNFLNLDSLIVRTG